MVVIITWNCHDSTNKTPPLFCHAERVWGCNYTILRSNNSIYPVLPPLHHSTTLTINFIIIDYHNILHHNYFQHSQNRILAPANKYTTVLSSVCLGFILYRMLLRLNCVVKPCFLGVNLRTLRMTPPRENHVSLLRVRHIDRALV